ncbi:MAG TPA: hypothetical protein VKF82_11005 [Candidatus Eremiobacteraceae bacterium]|nr:hypothetical protein [Candidatus Eremiobacteraceae bacterium]
MHALALARLVHPLSEAAFPWVAFILVAGWLILTLAPMLRRMSRRAQQAPQTLDGEADEAEQSPQGQRLAHTVQTIAAQAQAAAAAAAQQMQARMDAQTAAAAAKPAAAMGHDPLVLAAQNARQTVLGDLAGTLSNMVDQTAMPSTMSLPQTQPPAPAGPSPRIAHLATPDGLAYAIVAAAVIGQCAGLRSEPMQPGGW